MAPYLCAILHLPGSKRKQSQHSASLAVLDDGAFCKRSKPDCCDRAAGCRCFRDPDVLGHEFSCSTDVPDDVHLRVERKRARAVGRGFILGKKSPSRNRGAFFLELQLNGLAITNFRLKTATERVRGVSSVGAS